MSLRLITTLILLVIGSACSKRAPKPELRGAWIASVKNIDWPSRTGLPADAQRAEYRALLDEARRIGLNAVFVQVRPTADALYASPYEPWSLWLTGTQGQDPGYDVLGFLVEEAHARNLEFHAWFNPYRVTKEKGIDELDANHPARVHPDWVRTYGGQLYFDPGVPDVRAHIQAVIMDVVAKYDIDGVHFDDYFYPYPIENEEFGDDDTYRRYGTGFADKGDWRRDNVNVLIAKLGTAIHAAKPWVRFGVSPFAIWRNMSSDPSGSATNAFEAYSKIYADSRAWIKHGWIDYVVPQVYFPIGHPVAPYDVLVAWWAREVAGTSVDLYVGQGTFQIGNKGWTDPNEMLRHLEFNHTHDGVAGDVYFSMTKLRDNPLGTTELLRSGPYASPAVLPTRGPRRRHR